MKPASSSTLYSPLSINSPDCPYHTEATDAGNLSFPPREMPTHSTRRAIINAIQVVKDRNQGITNEGQQDWVSLVTFDLTSHVVVLHSLDNDYDAAIQDCTRMQACSDSQSCTATESGFIAAINLLNTNGRVGTNKVVVLLTDGKPNLYSSSNTTIANYRMAYSNSNYYGGTGSYPQDAALMQAAIMQGKNWMLFPIELGLQGDTDFMNRLYSIGLGKNGQTLTSPYSAIGDPSNYETELKDIFLKIITRPKVRLVQ